MRRTATKGARTEKEATLQVRWAEQIQIQVLCWYSDNIQQHLWIFCPKWQNNICFVFDFNKHSWVKIYFRPVNKKTPTNDLHVSTTHLQKWRLVQKLREQSTAASGVLRWDARR